MKKIKIKYSGMGGNFDDKNNFLSNILEKKYIIELSENPDFLIYSVNSKDYMKYNCVRIFYTAENLTPDFNICDYAIGFHYIDFQDRYYRLPIYLVEGFSPYKGDNYKSDFEKILSDSEKKSIKTEKTEFCSFVYSNSNAEVCRGKIFKYLSRYKTINSGGRYLNNIGGPIENKLNFQLKHKFAIAFENTSTSGYTTEKILNAFAANAIPIYWGNPDIELEFNTNAFVNCHSFGLSVSNQNDNSVYEKIVDEIIKIDSDDELFNKYINEKSFSLNYNPIKVKKEFEVFLLNIFEQDPQQAYRRNRHYWGERYERKQRIGNKFYWFLRKFSFFKKIKFW